MLNWFIMSGCLGDILGILGLKSRVLTEKSKKLRKTPKFLNYLILF